MRRTKIVVTMGPSTDSLEVVTGLIKKGVDALRINLSHGDEETWRRYIKYVRKAIRTLGKEVAIIADLQGADVRLGEVKNPIIVTKGSKYELKLAESSNGSYIPLPVKKMLDFIAEGDVAMVDDGRVRFRVERITASGIELVALNSGMITSRKSFSLAGKDPNLPPLTEKDMKDISFAIENDVDYLGLSYTRSAEHIRLLRDIAREKGGDPGILAKIESRAGVENAKLIAKEADGLVVARGDLGMHYALEEIPKLQKFLIDVSRSAGTPVIVATQFLESMMSNPLPTRSEVIDVMTAVFEGADALMLSGETSVGRYPIEAVEWLDRIIREAEREATWTKRKTAEGLQDRFAHGVVSLSESLKAKLVVYTRSGVTALRISSFRPDVDFYALSPNSRTRRRLSIVWGVRSLPVSSQDYDAGLEESLQVLKKEGELGYGDIVVLTYGMRWTPVHTIRVMQILA